MPRLNKEKTDSRFEREDILNKIHHSALKFLIPLTPVNTYKIIVNEAMRLVSAKYGSIFLEINGHLKRVYATNSRFYKIKVRKKGFTSKTFQEKKASVVDGEDIIKIHPEIKDMKIKSTIFIPLSYKNKSFGVLSVDSSGEEKFGKHDLSILKLFGSLATLAIRKTQLYDESQKALETRDLFISMAAHELRTPLTTLNGYIQLLNKKSGDLKYPFSKWVKELDWESKRLAGLINELLEINRIKTGQLNYVWTECDLKDILQKSINEIRIDYPNRKIILADNISEKKAIVIGDFSKLIQVFDNLLDNAVKFSAIEKKVILSFAKNDQDYFIGIQDFGKGIKKKDLQDILEGNHRKTDVSEKGLGYGLLLTKYIVVTHHGDLKITSQLNKGTTVKVRLPVIVYEQS